MALDIITIGDVAVDTYCLVDHDEAQVLCDLDRTNCRICFDFADKIPVKEVFESVGGNAANTAVGFNRLGFKTSIWAVLGQDEAGSKALLSMEKEGIDLNNIVRNGKTNQTIAMVYRGERTLFVHHEQRDYKFKSPEPAKWIYLTSLASGGEVIVDDIVTYAHSNNSKIIFNPGTFQLRLGPNAYRPILKNAEIIIMNKDEAMQYLDIKKPDIEILLLNLLKLGPTIAVITDGKNGAYAATEHTGFFCSIVDNKPIETTGAGDSFASGFVGAIMSGCDITDALKWGAANASSVVAQIGPQLGLLNIAQIKNSISSIKNSQTKEFTL